MLDESPSPRLHEAALPDESAASPPLHPAHQTAGANWRLPEWFACGAPAETTTRTQSSSPSLHVTSTSLPPFLVEPVTVNVHDVATPFLKSV